jgi:triosephosphate isomerase (TIM)
MKQTTMRRTLIAGNWKMNGSVAANAVLLDGIRHGANGLAADLAVCVPSPYFAQAQSVLSGSVVAWGGQDLSLHESGAYTGEVSGAMLHDFGCQFVIVGHSERRRLTRQGKLWRAGSPPSSVLAKPLKSVKPAIPTL